MTSDIVEEFRQKFGTGLVSITMPSDNRIFLELAGKNVLPQAMELLSKDFHARLITITCVDLPAYHELLYHLDIPGAVVTLRTRAWKPDIQMPSVASINLAAELIEHEITELFGIEFIGNPRETNMIIAESESQVKPLRNRISQLDTKLDGNISAIVEFGSTTAPSKRVMKTRTQMGMPENPPLCGVCCPAKSIVLEIAESTGTASRHPNLKKEADK